MVGRNGGFPNSQIIPTALLPPFEREPSGLPFAYSLFSYMFQIITTDLLQNFQAKNLYFQNQFSQHHFICGPFVADYIKRLWNLPLHIDLEYFPKLAPKTGGLFRWILSNSQQCYVKHKFCSVKTKFCSINAKCGVAKMYVFSTENLYF